MKALALPIRVNFFLLLCFATLCGSINAWSHPSQETEEKVYVSPEQIEVTEEGILVYDARGELVAIYKTLSYDKKGLFLKPIESERGPCGIHRVWCRYCQGCGVIYCPMKCECPNGVGG